MADAGPAPRAGRLPHLASYYDTSTFRGRLRYNWAICNPLGLRWNTWAVRSPASY